jgi:CBS domain-containing protein
MAIQRLQSLSVRDVMNDNVLTLSKNQLMSDAALLLAEHGIAAAPVLDDQGRCVGMLSATDFIRSNAESSLDADEHQLVKEGEHAPLHMDWQPEDLVSKHMTNAVQTVDANLPLLKAAEVMCVQHIHRLPALDEAGRPAGIISTMDVVAALVNAVDEMRIRERDASGSA